MLGKLFRKRTPLFDWLTKVSAELIIQFAEEEQENDNRLPIIIALTAQLGAGSFLRNTYPNLKKALFGASQDVVAFETLTFSCYALHEAYVSRYGTSAEDPFDDEKTVMELSECLQDAFATARGVCLATVSRHHTWGEASKVFEARLMEYIRADGLVGRNGAAEQFRFNLQTIGKAAVPAVNYGPPPLDLMLLVQAMAEVHAFAASIPAGLAEALANMISEFKLDW